MQIQQQTINNCYSRAIAWLKADFLEDWANVGNLYEWNKQRSLIAFHNFATPIDRAIISPDGVYAFIYQNLGTKGLLLKKGKLLREINRSPYHAGDYEYPAALATIAGVAYLIHCPLEYNRLDFEDIETGELVTNIIGREPCDYFHSRLEISPNSTFLMSKGWLWHPWDTVVAFDLSACLADPLLLDNTTFRPAVGTEVCTAGFIADELVLLGTSNEEAMDEDLEAALPPRSVAIWNIRTNELSSPRVVEEFGNLFPLNEKLAWDLYKCPKLLDLATGAIITSLPELDSGRQQSAIIRGEVPTIIFDRATGCIALVVANRIEILIHNYLVS